MSDIVERLKGTGAERQRTTAHDTPGHYLHVVAKISNADGRLMDEAADEITRLRAEVEKLKAAYSATQHDTQQTLGKALGYPWFKDDPTNFPTAIEADGVCVGDHVAESLADEAAAKITALRAEVEDLGNRLHHVHRLWANNEHALRAEVEKLKAALRVYAGPVGGDNFPHWSDGYPGGVMVEWNTIDFGDAARAALEEKP